MLAPGDGETDEACDRCGMPLGRPMRLLSLTDLQLVLKGTKTRTERLAGVKR